jgi:NADH-quinone oxidoreductase subunit J
MNDLLKYSLFDVINLAVLIVSALWAVLSPRLLRAVIGLALTSVCVTIALFRLDASLAGVFELSVCAGLISAVFISTISLSKIETKQSIATLRTERTRRYFYLPLILLITGIAISQLSFPEMKAVSTLGKDVRLILWTERHLDLLGQVTILLAGAFGVAVLFKEQKKHER